MLNKYKLIYLALLTPIVFYTATSNNAPANLYAATKINFGNTIINNNIAANRTAINHRRVVRKVNRNAIIQHDKARDIQIQIDNRRSNK